MALTRPTQPPTASLQAAEDWFVFGQWPYSFTSDGPVPEPEHPVPDDRYTRYGDLPDAIHRVWRTYGFLRNGHTWIVDPAIWEPIVEPWLNGLTFSHMPTDEHFVPLSRSSTGEIRLLGTTTLNSITIVPQSGIIYGRDNSRALPDDYFNIINELESLDSLNIAPQSPLAEQFDEEDRLLGDSLESLYGPAGDDQFYGQVVPQCEGGILPRIEEDIALLPILEIARYGTYPYKHVVEQHALAPTTVLYKKHGLPLPEFTFDLTSTAPRNPVLISGPSS